MPPRLVLPLQQHIGHPATPIVKAGDRVSKGQLIARNTFDVGANIHSPANGIVTAVEPRVIVHPASLKQLSIVIDTIVDSSDLTSRFATEKSGQISNLEWQSCSRESLLACVEQAGIVGLGGATFPTAVKLKSQTIETLIVNAMECEPYITCDDRMLRELGQHVISGAQIAARMVDASRIVFAIEDNKPDAIAALEKAILAQQWPLSMEIVVAPTKYPSGGEKQIVELVLAKQIPKGQLPASLGVIVQNVATLHAIYQAVVKNEALTRRLVTITGDRVKNPGNYWIPFGTQINYLMQHFGVTQTEKDKIIIGGPLMGQAIDNHAVPVGKSTNCVIFNSSSNKKYWGSEATEHQPCIRCSECEKACPVELVPQQLYWLSRSDQWEALESQGLSDCIECGACAYVCPSDIPLVHYFRYAKSAIRSSRLKQIRSDKAKQRFEFREMRLQRAKAERALKHKKAAEERKKAAQNKSDDPQGKQTAINQALERVKQKKMAQTNPHKQGETD